jgi:hypothetical protein
LDHLIRFRAARIAAAPDTPVSSGVMTLLRRVALFTALWLSLAVPLYAQSGVLEVRVTTDGRALPDAAVTARLRVDTAYVRLTATDTAGRATFQDLRAGVYDVVVERLGYATTSGEAVVGASGVARLELSTLERAVDLPGVLVESERRRTQFEESAGATRAELTQRDLKLLPSFGEADVLRAIEVLPGVVSTSDFSSSFNVRGGSADQNLILLDGLPIYNPFHLGGFFSVFNSDMVARAELLAGGFPGRYGSRVSSVLSVESHPGGTGFGVDAGVSLLATRVAVGFDVPASQTLGIKSGRMRLSARRSYFDQLLKPFFDFPYHLTDLQLYGEAWTNSGARLTVTGYTGEDVLDLRGTEDFPLKVRWNWGNDVIGTSYVTPLGDGRTLELRAGHTRFSTAIRFPEFSDTELRSRIHQSMAHADVTAKSGAATYGFGLALDYLRYDNLAQSGGTVFGQGAARGWMFGTYAQSTWQLSGWNIETSMRLDGWWPRKEKSYVSVQPRVAVKRFMGEDRAVKLAVGRYAQFTHSLRDEELPLGIDVWVLSGDRAPAVVSDQAQLGVESYFGSWFMAVETYYRWFEGVTANNVAEDPNDVLDDLLHGTGRSYGADLHVRRETGRVRPTLAVSWLKATRTFEDIFSGYAVPPQLQYAPIFDRRIDVDLVIQVELPREWELGMRWNLGTGLPYTRPLGSYLFWDYSSLEGNRDIPTQSDTLTAIVLGPRNSERYPTYHRLDVGVRRTFEKSWGAITPFIDVLNVYNRRNVLFYFYQYDESPPTRAGISMFPLLPTVGLEVRF